MPAPKGGRSGGKVGAGGKVGGRPVLGGKVGSRPGAGRPGMNAKPGVKPGTMGNKPGSIMKKPGSSGMKPGTMPSRQGTTVTRPGAKHGTIPGTMGNKPVSMHGNVHFHGTMGTRPEHIVGKMHGNMHGNMPGGSGTPMINGGFGALHPHEQQKLQQNQLLHKQGTMQYHQDQQIMAGMAADYHIAHSLRNQHSHEYDRQHESISQHSPGLASEHNHLLQPGQNLHRGPTTERPGVAGGEVSHVSGYQPTQQLDQQLNQRDMSISELAELAFAKKKTKKKKEKDKQLQNTLGGNALTSATPTALSSHVDPRMLHAAAGMAGMGFVATAASATNEDGDDVAGTPGEENPEFTQVEIDGEEPAGNGYSETMAPPPAPSELMRVTQIGENHPYPEESYQTQPLLSNTDNTELGYHSQSKHIPLENMTTLPPMQHQTTNFSFNNKPYTDNYLNTVQYYDTSTSDGMYCYSCIMFLGVLCIGIGIVLVIVEIFGLFGQTKYLAYSGGGVLFLGITTLASSMFAWRRHRSQIKKKLAHV